MRHVTVGESFEEFRATARALASAGVLPAEVTFADPDSAPLLFPELLSQPPRPVTTADGLRVPRAFLALGEVVAAHRSPLRWSLLYQILFRLVHGESNLLQDPSDAAVLELGRMRQSVDRDVHKTHAFVRFRRVEEAGVEHFIAWHEPQHRSLHLAAPHFVRRFSSMRWSILTPDATARWDLKSLHFGPGVPRSEAPAADVLEELWRTYYSSVFNPARVNVRAMRAELPRRHWATLPEAALISSLVRQAPRRTSAMVKASIPSPSAALVPPELTVPALRHAALGCRLCPWAAAATQTVFGEGPARAEVMLVGEQPGDFEDLQGRPFVGPAGMLLDEVLAEVGLPRQRLYVTNAVKHFKFERTGKRRIHQKPSAGDIHTCKGWLEAEVRAVQPRIIVALGATAGQAFLGPTFRLIRSRGQFLETPWTSYWLATYHPSALLRIPDATARAEAKAHFREDLAKVAAALLEAA